MTRARVRVREACRAGRGGGLQRAALRQGRTVLALRAALPCRHRRIAEDPEVPYHEDARQGAVQWPRKAAGVAPFDCSNVGFFSSREAVHVNCI
jgi:hypothetical protein